MIKPLELESAHRGRDIWEMLSAAEAGDTTTLRRLLDRDPELFRAEYWYTHPIHLSVREGHLDAVQILLDAGADPEWNAYYDGDLIEMARDRGHESIAQLLEEARKRRGRVAPGEDHPIHAAAEADHVKRVHAFLDADPTLVNRGDRSGGTPLHRAVMGSARRVIDVLLDRGGDIHALHSTSRGWWAYDVQSVDIAIWGRNTLAPAKGDFKTARLLLKRGAKYDLTLAAALGDIDGVRAFLNQDPGCVRQLHPNGRRALTGAAEFGHTAIVRLLLERGADPCWPESGAPKGAALRAAVASSRNREMVELLLAHGADPNSELDSGGSAASWAASIPELRALMIAHGGKVHPQNDEEILQRVKEDPNWANEGCGGVLTLVCSDGKRELLARLLEAGVRVPSVLTQCRGYLFSNTDMFRMLLASGMSPNLPNWHRQTFLHDVCGGGKRGQVQKSLDLAAMLLDAGASINAWEEDYRSTPLGFAARNNMPDMVEFLLARGAAANLPDDPPWATPLAWAQRRGHVEIAEILRKAGASL